MKSPSEPSFFDRLVDTVGDLSTRQVRTEIVGAERIAVALLQCDLARGDVHHFIDEWFVTSSGSAALRRVHEAVVDASIDPLGSVFASFFDLATSLQSAEPE